MTDAKQTGGRGKYVATPISVTFPATFPNDKLAGQTMTWKGRGRHPTWYDLAVDAGLIASKEVETETEVSEAPASDTAKA
jgi:hypothetical protein